MYECESWTIKLSTKELMLLNCGVGETLESPLDYKEIQSVHSKGNKSWIFIGRTDVEVETPVVWPLDMKSWFIWKDALKDSRQDDKGTRGWDGWMASPTQWTWVWGNSESRWWTGRPGMLQSMGSQRVGDDWATELNQTELASLDSLVYCDSNKTKTL